MRNLVAILCLSLAATMASAQYGMPGGMPDGGGRPGGGEGRRGPPGGGRGFGRPPMQIMSPLARDKLDKPVTAMFRAADTNGDGTVTLAELQAVIAARRAERIAARFKQIDTDHNGAISSAEFFAWQHAMGSVASTDQQAVVAGGGPIAETIGPELGDKFEDRILARVIEPLNATMLVAANTNYDAGVSLDELLAYERKRFDDLDANHDGQLTPDELRSLRPRGGRGEGGFEPPPGE